MSKMSGGEVFAEIFDNYLFRINEPDPKRFMMITTSMIAFNLYDKWIEAGCPDKMLTRDGLSLQTQLLSGRV